MNYFEHHIGDYDQATAHLTSCEDGIYSRLIRWYMASEQPLPADPAAIQRRVRAHSRDEKAAVRTVLAEFFELRDGVYHQHRCDEEIARYQDKQAKARKSADARWSAQRAQSERNANASAEHDASDMRTHSERNATRAHASERTPTRAPARPHSPDTKHQTPEEGAQTTATTVARAPELPEPNPPEANGQQPTPAGRVCRAIRGAGVPGVNPGDPRLTALLAQGATEAEFTAVATEAAAASPPKGWAWVLKVVQSRRTEAAAIRLAPAAAPAPAAANPAAAWLAEQADRAREVDEQRAARLARKGAAS